MDWIEKAAAKIRATTPTSPTGAPPAGAPLPGAPTAPESAKPLPRRLSTAPATPRPDALDLSGLLRTSRVDLDFAALKSRGLLTPDAPRSKTAEEFRIIKRNVLRRTSGALDGPHNNVLMVTSARPGEGKTFIAVNLALSLALERDRTVLLVDCDVTHPEALRVLGVRAEFGLVDILEDPAVDLGSSFIRTNIENLVLLPAGRFNPMSTELFASERMRTIIDEMALRYADRIIILDAPPVLATSEPGVLSEYASRIVLVVEAEKTADGEIETAIEHLRATDRTALVLNKTRSHGNQEEFGYYYGGSRHA